MYRKCPFFSSIAYGVGIAILFAHIEPSQGGWTGGMNGSGYGWAGVNVTSSIGTNKAVRTVQLLNPSAAMAPATGFVTNATLPTGSSTNTVARIKGSAGYVWKANTVGSNGDKTDNEEIEQRVVIRPAICTSLAMESEIGSFDPQTGSGLLTVRTVGTAGTALLLRGYEIGDFNNVPADDPETPQDESLIYVKTHGSLKFENLVVGPFEYGYNGQCELIIPFTVEGGNLDNLFFVSDGMAKGSPMTIACPGSYTVECAGDFVYPPAEVNTCRNVTLLYEPAERDLKPGLNTVTVTATDDLGDTASCSFSVNVIDTHPPAVPVLPDVMGQCGSTVTLVAPTTTDSCSGTITGTTTTVFPITQTGTTIVPWTFTDNQGNRSTANQNVIIVPYTFSGFYAPINAVGGSCSSVGRIIQLGSTIPVKFDFKCDNAVITAGVKPVVKIQQWSSTCQLVSEPVSIQAEYQNYWHINWDTTGWVKGIYKIIAVLPDGTSHFVFVRLK